MIQRRQFIGTLAAATAFGTARLWGAGPLRDGDNVLDWKCRIIETLPHNQARRFPVVTDVSIQQNGQLLAIVGDDHFVCIYDLQQDNYVEHLERHTDWVRAAKFSNDGKLLATAGNDRQLFVWEVGNWKSPRIFRTHPEAIFDVAISPDGQRVATVGFESKLRLYNIQNGILEKVLDCPCKDMHAVAFSPDSQLLAAGGRCGNVRIWQTVNGQQKTQYRAHRQRIRTIQFRANNELLSAGDDQLVKIANPNIPNAIRSLPRQNAKLYAVQGLSDGLVATGGSDNLIRIWKTSDGSEYGVLKGHTGTITSLDRNQNYLVSGSYDTQVRIWDTQSVKTAQAPNGFAPPARRAESNQFNSGWNQKLN